MNPAYVNPRFAATIELQRPDGRAISAGGDAGYRDPASLVGRDVCPHCKQPTDVFLVSCDGHVVESHRCVWHGDVVPMRSHVVNPG